MLQAMLVVFTYVVVSWVADLLFLGTLGHNMSKTDSKVGVPFEDRLASPLFVSLSCLRVSGLIYLISLLYRKNIPVALFVVLVALELYRGMAQMLHQVRIGRPDIGNYYTSKTIGSAVGYTMMTYWVYFH